MLPWALALERRPACTCLAGASCQSHGPTGTPHPPTLAHPDLPPTHPSTPQAEAELAGERERLGAQLADLQAQLEASQAAAAEASAALEAERQAAAALAAQAEESAAAVAAELAAVREQLGGEAAAAQAALAAEGERLQAELDQAQGVAVQLAAEKETLEVRSGRPGQGGVVGVNAWDAPAAEQRLARCLSTTRFRPTTFTAPACHTRPRRQADIRHAETRAARAEREREALQRSAAAEIEELQAALQVGGAGAAGPGWMPSGCLLLARCQACKQLPRSPSRPLLAPPIARRPRSRARAPPQSWPPTAPRRWPPPSATPPRCSACARSWRTCRPPWRRRPRARPLAACPPPPLAPAAPRPQTSPTRRWVGLAAGIQEWVYWRHGQASGGAAVRVCSHPSHPPC